MKSPKHLVLLGLTIAGLPATAATLTSGHVDMIGIAYDGTNFEPHSHAEPNAIVDGNPVGNAPDGVEYAPGDLIVQVNSTTTRASGAEWSLIGVASGVSYNLLHETDIPGKPFVGIGAEELTAGDWLDGEIKIKLTGMTGPAGGHFSLYQGSVTPNFFMSTVDGITAADVFVLDLDVEDHAHFNWGFTEEGTYDLTFEISGTHTVDGPKAASATYSFSVIPEPSSALLGAFGALALLRRRRN
jgi:surface-anchored protein